MEKLDCPWKDPSDIASHLSPYEFARSLPPEQLAYLKVQSASTLIDTICNQQRRLEQPFFMYLFVKPQPSKRSTRMMALINSSFHLITVNLADSEAADNGLIKSIIVKGKRDLHFTFDSKQEMKFTVKQPFGPLGPILSDIMGPTPPPLYERILIPFISLPPDAPKEFPSFPFFDSAYKSSLLQLILSPDLTFFQTLQAIPCSAAMIRDIGDALEPILIKNHRMGLFVTSLAPILMENTQSANLTLRGESLLTRVISCLRNRYCAQYYTDFLKDLIEVITPMNCADDFIPAFIGLMRAKPLPPPIQYVCSILFQEAEKRFPNDESAAISSVSGYILLRGMGPLLVPKGASQQLKFSLLSMLFNLAPNPNLTPFIPSMRELLQKIGRTKVESVDWGEISDDECDKKLPIIHKFLIEKSKDVIDLAKEYLHKPVKPGIYHFIEAAVEEAKIV